MNSAVKRPANCILKHSEINKVLYAVNVRAKTLLAAEHVDVSMRQMQLSHELKKRYYDGKL